MNNAGTNRAYEYYRRNSNNANSFKRENVRIKQIGDYFNTFSTIDNNYLLDLVTTTTPSYLLEIEKGNYEKFKKMIEEKEKQEKTAFLKTLSIFKTFSYDSLFNFSECVEYRTIPCGQTILNFNQPLDEFYIIKRGKCNVYRRLFLERDGQVKTAKIYVGQFGPGDYFGERGIIEYHGFLHIKNIEIIDQFFSNPIADKDPILSELCVVAVKDKCEPSIYDTELDQQEINYTNKSNANDSTTPDFLKQTISIEEKKFQQKKIREEKTIELAVIALNKARLKFQNTIEYSKFEKLSQDELYCKYLESSEEKNWNKLKEHLNNGRLKEILNDPTITVSKLDEMKGKERWKI
ncbi:hypothetical protein LY90DRAFT_674617 [Neocallimastix californiae]|uniref:Cyclic nucleotide-binding domain-containing protein n=1 Tax=Neocallimastix californiae TaxID=1754190 RepID=A0A1Y2AV80_9FUNG|nr:hypothetical protein LY90DRAFT_674617 [Neocallimastix californiae]|eukprot:ORY26190.1 hypothetical protein LY90DRAFT_674617 [Neocallimastix californiae]